MNNCKDSTSINLVLIRVDHLFSRAVFLSVYTGGAEKMYTHDSYTSFVISIYRVLQL